MDSPSLLVTHPELADQLLVPFDPTRFTEASTAVVWWRGPLGHVWQASISQRLDGGQCPVCSRLQPPAPGRSVAERHPDLAAEAAGWDPAEVSAGSRAEMPWTCRVCGTSWSAEVRARTRGHRPCPECLKAEHPSLVTTHPDLAAQMVAPFDPKDYTRGSKQKVRWRGPRGHEWEATVANRVKGSGCPVCAVGAGGRARQRPEPGASLADIYPQIAREADGWDPHDYRPKSAARLPWVCASCGHHWRTTVFQRTQRSGCPVCARSRRLRRVPPPA